ncbi:AAA family ATPase [Escherichia coli]|nr:AAA family ATPase [Escherichia coli]
MTGNHPAALLRRLNPYCARALDAAASLCQTRAHAEITIEHWLLKLLEQGEGDITVIARRYEWDIDTLWQSLLAHLDTLPRSVRERPQLSEPLTALIRQAWLIASLEGDDPQIRSQHLLMALTEKPMLPACNDLWVLLSLSRVQLERLRPLLDAQSDECPARQPQATEPLTSAQPESATTDAPAKTLTGKQDDALLAVLNRFTEDVTEKARSGRIDPVFGRDTEIRQMVDILSRRRKNNPILVGEPGVGKTALVEGLALRITEGNVPDSLKTVHIRTLDLGLLQAGAGVKGEFEQRLKNVIDAVQKSPEPVLLFIDEAHTIIGAGNQAGGADAANLLKPALARGELRTIAATTWSEYKQYFERDAALERRFQMVKVDEPDDDTASLMLRGLKARYAQHHGVHMLDSAIQTAVRLSRRYLTGRQLPDKAVDLLDTAGARVRMSLDTLPEPLTQLQARLTALDVDARAVATVVADWTGIPLSSLLRDEQSDLLSMEQSLENRVVGQSPALCAIAQRLRAAKTGLTPENGPQGVFLLTGPSGTGKTETALTLADTLFGGEKSLITINLSEYQEPHTVSQLKGSPPGYVGYGQGGVLTEAVRKRPYSVVLLDEVEKAHRDVMNLFYQVFDRGFMRDGEGREIDFRNTVILMTANLGSDHIMQLLEEKPDATDADLHELLYPLLREHFQPALMARFQTVIYRPLGQEAMRAIVEMKLAQVVRRLRQHYGLETEINDSLYDALTAACLLPDTGARNIDSLLNQQILPVLSQQLLAQQAAHRKPAQLRLGWDEEDGIVLEFATEEMQ